MRYDKALTLCITGISSFLPLSLAFAQDAGLEEVVITARQREERVLDVPATVQAFTATEIKSAGIERAGDFVALTPGLAQVQTAEIGDLQLSIRGINTGRDAETNFALVIDGVLQTNPNAFNQEFANIQQIEVLKGPQGAIYGRNAVAGAVIITTRRPTDEFEASATVGYGNKNTQKANFYLGGPVGGGVKAGLGGFYRNTDGFFENSFLGCDDCVDYYEEYGVTPRAIFALGENGTIDVRGKWSKVSAGAINFNGSFALPFFATLTNNPDFFQDVNRHSFVYINNIVPDNDQTNKNFSIKGDWDLGVGTLTAWAAYNDQENSFITDARAQRSACTLRPRRARTTSQRRSAGRCLRPPSTRGRRRSCLRTARLVATAISSSSATRRTSRLRSSWHRREISRCAG